MIVSAPVFTPVTTPVGLTAALALVALQVPPAVVLDSVAVEPLHTDDEPVIVPAVAGMVTTATGCVVIAVPQVLLTVYSIVSIPVTMPVTMPVLPTVALAVVALQVPPVAASARVTVPPAHTFAGPVMAPASGNGLMVMGCVTVVVPQPLVTAYSMVSVPAVTPVTMPVLPIVA